MLEILLTKIFECKDTLISSENLCCLGPTAIYFYAYLMNQLYLLRCHPSHAWVIDTQQLLQFNKFNYHVFCNQSGSKTECTKSCGSFPWFFSVVLFRGYFPWVFSVGIFSGYFQWVFSVGIFPWVFSIAHCRVKFEDKSIYSIRILRKNLCQYRS